jgi:hypothetical protein
MSRAARPVRSARSALAVLGALGALALGCSDRPPSPPGQTLSGQVTYVGPLGPSSGPLTVGVWNAWPPVTRPIGYHTFATGTWTIPQPFTLEGLPPGDYFVGAAVDANMGDTPHPYMLNPHVDSHGYFPSETAAAPVHVANEAGAAGVAFGIAPHAAGVTVTY